MFVEDLPSGRYRGGYRIGTGRGARKITRTFDYRWEAEAWAIGAEGRFEAGLPEDEGAPDSAPSTTVAAYGHDYLTRRAGDWSRSHQDGQATHLRGIINTGLGDQPMDQLKRSQVQTWMTAQKASGVGASTMNARLKLLRALYADAMSELLVNHDPTKDVPTQPLDTLPDRVLTKEQEARLLIGVADDPVWTAQLLLGLDAGLRWQELAGLSIDGLLMDVGPHGFVSVHQVVERTTGTLRHYTKSKQPRLVPMTARLRAALGDVSTGGLADPQGLLWRAQQGGLLNYWASKDELGYLSHRVQVKPKVSWHQLRHTYGSRLAAAGVPRSEIATLLGHADEETTKRYIHGGDAARQAALVIGALG